MTNFSEYLPPGVDPCRWGHNTFLPCSPLTCRCKEEWDREHGVSPTRREVAWTEERERKAAEELVLNQPADWMTFLTDLCRIYIP